MSRRLKIWFGLGLMVLSIGLAVLVAQGAINGSGGSDDLVAAPVSVEGTLAPTSAVPPGDVAGGGDEGTTTTTAPLRAFTIAATGDLLIHSPVYNRALENGGGTDYEFSPMLDPIAEEIAAADLAICHMETPLSADNTGLSGYPVFNTPNELARDAAEAGYDTCSTASNHSLDRGFAGVQATLDTMDAAGLMSAGTARTAEEAATPTIIDVAGVRVAHLSYAFGFNGFSLPADAPFAANLIDEQQILADAAAARAAGAEFVVVSLHWGDEYQRDPSERQRALANALLTSPEVDLIVGTHVHVVQPIEKIGDKYVIYGLGNLLSNQSPAAGLLAATQDGVVVNVAVEEVSPGEFRSVGVTYTPTQVARPSYRVEPVDAATNPDSYQRTVDAINLLGPEAFDGQPTR